MGQQLALQNLSLNCSEGKQMFFEYIKILSMPAEPTVFGIQIWRILPKQQQLRLAKASIRP